MESKCTALTSPLLHTTVPENWCITQSKIIKLRYAWTINNIFCFAESNEELQSSPFYDNAGDGVEWILLFSATRLGYLPLFIKLYSCRRETLQAKFEFSILDPEMKKTNIHKAPELRKFERGKEFGYKQFIALDKLKQESNYYLTDGKLTICCEVTYMTDIVNTSSQPDIIVPECKLIEDLGKLFENERFCDVTLIVNGHELKAHKAILSARSDVFAAMFEHKLEEEKLNRVCIMDIDHDVVKEMLRFIYTGKAPNIHRMASNLLVAADKYALVKLKKMCENALHINLSINTAAETLIFADLYCAEELKAKTLVFITNNASYVIKTQGWQEIIRTHFDLAVDVIQAAARK